MSKKTITLLGSEYSKLMGYSHNAGYVRRALKEGKELPGIIESRSTNTGWVLEVDLEWYNEQLTNKP